MASEPLHVRVDRMKSKVDRCLSDAQDAIGKLTAMDLPDNVTNMAHEMFAEIERMRWRLRKRPSR